MIPISAFMETTNLKMVAMAIELTYGHAKDKIYDLKRFSMGMIVNQHGMPLFTQAYSGNSSDKETIVEAMKRLKENIEFPDDVYFIRIPR